MIFQLLDDDTFYAEVWWHWLRQVNAWLYWLYKHDDDSDAWQARTEQARWEQKRAQEKSPCEHRFKLNEQGDPLCSRCGLHSILGYRVQEDK